jgi:large subunit ribosomal protein L47
MSFHTSSVRIMSLDEFFDKRDDNTGAIPATGRGWTVPELRRKSFDDLHKLWFVLYKERNLLLTDRERKRRMGNPITQADENRYTYVKRGMAGIKIVIKERKRIESQIITDSATSESARNT